MTTQEKLEKLGCSMRLNMGWQNGTQSVVSYSAIKNGKAIATAKTKTKLQELVKQLL